MTNREIMLMVLKGEVDDYGAEEAAIYYNIACPYRDNRGECVGKEITRDLCSECKEKWLDSEVDE